MNNYTVWSRMISNGIWFSNFSIFGMRGLILMQLSFSLRESSSIFTDLSLFITTGDTKQSSSTSFVISKCPDFINFYSSRPHLLVDVEVPVCRFVLLRKVPPYFSCMLISVSFIVSLLFSDPTFYKWGKKIMICDAFFFKSLPSLHNHHLSNS